MKQALSLVVSLAVIVCGLIQPSGQVSAQGSWDVVAEGLDNPRGLAFGPDGSLYVTEAGTGGAAPCFPSPAGPGEVCAGNSGAITRVQQGRQSRIATGLPSVAGEGGTAAIGPVDIAMGRDNQWYAVIGLGANPENRALLGPAGMNYGQIVQLQANGQTRNVVDVAGYELSDNPDADVIDSNPYALTPVANGWLVVDAGGNSLLMVDSGGRISTIATFDSRTVPAPPLPMFPPGAMIPMHSVPTTVAVGPDGAYYVGELTGFPFPVGAARIHRIVPGRSQEVWATGFTNIISVKFGPDGSLYVLEITKGGLLAAEAPGADPMVAAVGQLIRVAPNGTRSVVASEGLIAPGGLAIGPDGHAYVSNFSILPGLGQVVRIPLGTAPTAAAPTTPAGGGKGGPAPTDKGGTAPTQRPGLEAAAMDQPIELITEPIEGSPAHSGPAMEVESEE